MNANWTVAQCKTVINTYKEFYSEDRLDINIYSFAINDNLTEGSTPDTEELNGLTYFQCTVYHPEITITNEKGMSHKITDVYVSVVFPSLTISLGRTSYSPEEVAMGYIHSHVHSGNYFTQMNDFCTGGSDTPINRIKRNIKNFNGTNDEFTTLISSFIIEVERMIRIESLEGGPYIRMSSIHRGIREESIPITLSAGQSLSLSMTRGIKATYIKDIKDFFMYYASLKLDFFYYDGHNWQLSCSDDEFIHRVTKVAKIYKGTRSKSGLFKDALYMDGLYYDNNSTSYFHIRPNTYASWQFKSQLLKITVKDSSKQRKIKRCSILNDNIISALYNFLLNIINSVYANNKYKDSFHTRTYKVTRALVKKL